MKYKIGIFGSAAGDYQNMLGKAEELGNKLAKHKNIILITGAADGLPYKVVETADAKGTEIWGYSPACDLKTQKELSPKQNFAIYKKLEFIPKDYFFKNDILVCRKYRNVTSTANCDAGIIISGRWGSMNEFTNLYDMGKIIGVLTGTGGIADEILNLMKKISKPGKAKVLFNSNPKKLIDGILIELGKR